MDEQGRCILYAGMKRSTLRWQHMYVDIASGELHQELRYPWCVISVLICMHRFQLFNLFVHVLIILCPGGLRSQETDPLWSSLQPAMLSSLGMLLSWWHRECNASCHPHRWTRRCPVHKLMQCSVQVFHAPLHCRYCDAVDLNCGCPQK